MNFELDEDQRAVLDGVNALLEEHAGPERARKLQEFGEYDADLDRALRDAGFTEVAREEGMGALEAALVSVAVSRAAGAVAFANEAVVAPALSAEALGAPIAICRAQDEGPIRYAAQARTLLVLDGDAARRVALGPDDTTPVHSNFGYAMARISESARSGGDSLGEGAGDTLARWWRIAIGVEAVGAMSGALDQTVGYLKERTQFRRHIASFQAVQHRLAECAISVEAARWLVLEAAHQGAPAEGTATAVAYAMQAAAQVFSETHQLSGAIGFTREHDLHVHTMRLQALRLELGGMTAHRREAVDRRWGLSA